MNGLAHTTLGSNFTGFERATYAPMSGRLIHPEEQYRDAGYPFGKSMRGLKKWTNRNYRKGQWKFRRVKRETGTVTSPNNDPRDS